MVKKNPEKVNDVVEITSAGFNSSDFEFGNFCSV